MCEADLRFGSENTVGARSRASKNTHAHTSLLVFASRERPGFLWREPPDACLPGAVSFDPGLGS